MQDAGAREFLVAALVAATHDRFAALARFPAIELAGDVLVVRNGRGMTAFRLSLAGG